MPTYIADNTFAAACYDQNTIAELTELIAKGPDEHDMRTWDLTPDQWSEQVTQALNARCEEAATPDEPESEETCDECGAHLDGPHDTGCTRWDTF